MLCETLWIGWCAWAVVLMAIAVAVTFSSIASTQFLIHQRNRKVIVQNHFMLKPIDSDRRILLNVGMSFAQSIDRNYLPIWCVRGRKHRHINSNHFRRFPHFRSQAPCAHASFHKSQRKGGEKVHRVRHSQDTGSRANNKQHLTCIGDGLLWVIELIIIINV